MELAVRRERLGSHGMYRGWQKAYVTGFLMGHGRDDGIQAGKCIDQDDDSQGYGEGLSVWKAPPHGGKCMHCDSLRSKQHRRVTARIECRMEAVARTSVDMAIAAVPMFNMSPVPCMSAWHE
jgi:hypothetical protein